MTAKSPAKTPFTPPQTAQPAWKSSGAERDYTAGKQFKAVGVLDYNDECRPVLLRPFYRDQDVDLPEETETTELPGHWPNTLGWLFATCLMFELDTLWVTPRAALGPLALPESAPRGQHEFVMLSRISAECQISPNTGELAPWYIITGPEGIKCSIALPHLDKDGPWCEAQDGVQLLAGLMHYRQALGSDWYRSTTTTGAGLAAISSRVLDKVHLHEEVKRGRYPLIATMREIYDRDGAHSDVPTFKLVPGDYRTPVVTSWTRPLRNLEEGSAWLQEFDARASYLSAIGSTEIGIGEPVEFEFNDAPCTKVGKPLTDRVGYWRTSEEIALPADIRAFLPELDWQRSDGWMSTSVFDFLRKDLKLEFRLSEALLFPESIRPFDGLAERLRAARNRLRALSAKDPAAKLAENANKGVYTAFWGWVGRTERGREDSLWNPHAKDVIGDKGKVNQWRRVIKAGLTSDRWPVAMRNDELIYATDSDTAELAAQQIGLPYGEAGGMFDQKRRVPLYADLASLLGDYDEDNWRNFWPMFERAARRAKR